MYNLYFKAILDYFIILNYFFFYVLQLFIVSNFLFQFKPLEQLMSVFPAASGKFLPPTWRELMSSPVSYMLFIFQ